MYRRKYDNKSYTIMFLARFVFFIGFQLFLITGINVLSILTEHERLLFVSTTYVVKIKHSYPFVKKKKVQNNFITFQFSLRFNNKIKVFFTYLEINVKPLWHVARRFKHGFYAVWFVQSRRCSSVWHASYTRNVIREKRVEYRNCFETQNRRTRSIVV